MTIYLASKSPRRRELFSLITDSFTCVTAEVDEHSVCAQDGESLSLALGRLKCRAAAETRPDGVVIGCDTVVEIDRQILGKPHSRDDARRMLRLLSGRRHNVYTGVCVRHAEFETSFAVCTGVRFFPIPERELEPYIQTAEPYDKAGGYGIQGWAARWIEGIDGDYYNVMGLPVSRLYHCLLVNSFV